MVVIYTIQDRLEQLDSRMNMYRTGQLDRHTDRRQTNRQSCTVDCRGQNSSICFNGALALWSVHLKCIDKWERASTRLPFPVTPQVRNTVRQYILLSQSWPKFGIYAKRKGRTVALCVAWLILGVTNLFINAQILTPSDNPLLLTACIKGQSHRKDLYFLKLYSSSAL